MPRPRRSSCLRAGRFRPFLELLERRDTPSIVAPTPDQPGPLVVIGTDGPDHFVLRPKSGNPTRLQVSDNGGSTFTDVYYYGLNGIQIKGLGGDDDLLISQWGGFVGVGGGLTVQYDGGPGHDTLHLDGHSETTADAVYNIGSTVDSGSFAITTPFRSLTVNFTQGQRALWVV